jgi:putative DNA primase/helicase
LYTGQSAAAPGAAPPPNGEPGANGTPDGNGTPISNGVPPNDNDDPGTNGAPPPESGANGQPAAPPRYIEATADSPCPFCERTSGCKVQADGEWAGCLKDAHPRESHIGRNGQRYFIFTRKEIADARRAQKMRRENPFGAKDGRYRIVGKHVAELRASGLSDETIRLAGIHTWYARAHAAEITAALRWQFAYRGNRGNALAIPYPNRDGTASDYGRLKFDKPRTKKNQRTGEERAVKYEAPIGVPLRAFFPPRTLEVLDNPAVPLIVTEGEKKSLKADQEAFPTVGLAGVDAWSVRRAVDEEGRPTGPRELIADLAAIPWQGRQVFVVFDSDAVTNQNVLRAEYQLASALAERGAVVRVVRLPPGPPDDNGNPAKVGLDDYFVAGHTAEDLRQLLAVATDPERPGPTLAEQMARVEVREGAADPHRQARLFLRRPAQVRPYGQVPDIDPKTLQLRFWNEEYFEHDGAAYRKVPPQEMRSRIVESVKCDFDVINRFDIVQFHKRRQADQGAGDGGGGDEKSKAPKQPPNARKVTSGLVTNVVQAVGGLTLLPGSITPPAWLFGDGPFPANEVLAAKNALVHLPSLVAGAKDFSCPPTPRFFSTNALDYDFAINAPAPVQWLEFLAKLWPNDAAAIRFLQTWFGYCLTPDTSQQKILIIVGPKRSGKGTIARVLRAMIGPQNVAGPTFSSLATNFGLWPLIGKTLAIFGDARLSGSRNDQEVIVERLLDISGEDALTVDRKNMAPVDLKLSTRLMLLSNELPRLNDASGALASRFLLMHTPRSWYGKEDTKLTEKLLTELPGILLWAIEGWRLLREQGRFIQPESGGDLLEAMADLSSPVSVFVRECCETGVGLQVPKGELYSRFKEWCESKGMKNAPLESTFGRDLLAACPSVRAARPREGEVRVQAYTGIKLLISDREIFDQVAKGLRD